VGSISQEEKARKLLRMRLEMAKFLQETLRESGLKANAHILGSDAFKEFFRKVCRAFLCHLFDPIGFPSRYVRRVNHRQQKIS
jgi:hypothetical protein